MLNTSIENRYTNIKVTTIPTYHSVIYTDTGVSREVSEVSPSITSIYNMYIDNSINKNNYSLLENSNIQNNNETIVYAFTGGINRSAPPNRFFQNKLLQQIPSNATVINEFNQTKLDYPSEDIVKIWDDRLYKSAQLTSNPEHAIQHTQHGQLDNNQLLFLNNINEDSSLEHLSYISIYIKELINSNKSITNRHDFLTSTYKDILQRMTFLSNITQPSEQRFRCTHDFIKHNMTSKLPDCDNTVNQTSHSYQQKRSDNMFDQHKNNRFNNVHAQLSDTYVNRNNSSYLSEENEHRTTQHTHPIRRCYRPVHTPHKQSSIKEDIGHSLTESRNPSISTDSSVLPESTKIDKHLSSPPGQPYGNDSKNESSDVESEYNSANRPIDSSSKKQIDTRKIDNNVKSINRFPDHIIYGNKSHNSRVFNRLPYPRLTLQHNALDPLLFIIWLEEIHDFSEKLHISKNDILSRMKFETSKEDRIIPKFLRKKIRTCNNWEEVLIELPKNFKSLTLSRDYIKIQIRGIGPLSFSIKAGMARMRQKRLNDVEKHLHLYYQFFEENCPLRIEDYKASFMSFFTIYDSDEAWKQWHGIMRHSHTSRTNIRDLFQDRLYDMKEECRIMSICYTLWNETVEIDKTSKKHKNVITPCQTGVAFNVINSKKEKKAKNKSISPTSYVKNQNTKKHPISKNRKHKNQINHSDKTRLYENPEGCNNPFCLKEKKHNSHKLYNCQHLDKIRNNEFKFPYEENCTNCLKTFSTNPSCLYNCRGIVKYSRKNHNINLICNKHKLMHYRLCTSPVNQTDIPKGTTGIKLCGDLGDLNWMGFMNRRNKSQNKTT